MTEQKQFSIDELSELTALPVRTIRFYIQMGLVDRPVGQKRASHYLVSHLERLLAVKRLAVEGLSLEAIRKKLGDASQEISGGDGSTPPGTVTVHSHIAVAPGIELVVNPQASGLSAQEIRRLINGVLETVRSVRS